MRRFTIDEMIKMTPEEFGANWTAIAVSAYEEILDVKLDIPEDETESEIEL